MWVQNTKAHATPIPFLEKKEVIHSDCLSRGLCSHKTATKSLFVFLHFIVQLSKYENR